MTGSVEPRARRAGVLPNFPDLSVHPLTMALNIIIFKEEGLGKLLSNWYLWEERVFAGNLRFLAFNKDDPLFSIFLCLR
jgi:hypothetical protein